MEKIISTTVDPKKERKDFEAKNLSFIVEKNNDRMKDSSSISHIEKVILAKLQGGDYSAFSSIFSAYYHDLVIFATRYTKELNHSEEIVQDTFVLLWEQRSSIKINTSLKSYLLKTVQNKCIDWFRHKKIIQTHKKYVLEKPPQFALNTDSYLLYSELNERIENALKLLPESISETFRMNRQKGLKYSEIAEIQGVSLRTIEVRIGKALHILRHYLRDYFVSICFLLASGFIL